MTELVETPYGVMSNDRRLISLSDLCASNGGIQTGPFGSQLHQADYVVDGIPIVTVEHLGDRRINGDEAPKVSSEDVARLAKYSLEEGDIVFSRVGSVDRCSLVTLNEAGWLFSGRCLRVRPKKSEVDSVYISYFFRVVRFKDYIRAIAVGATMPSINTEIMRSIKVPVPPLAEQRAIAGVLGALDDKIESNRRQQSTLLGICHAAFDVALMNGADVMKVEDMVRFRNNERKPLSAMERAGMERRYPYYGATGVFDYVEAFLFDDVNILIGEDGSVVNDDGTPVAQMAWGKYWVNNHAHVLSGKAVSTELAYIALARSDVRPLITGAVQLKINMGNLRSLEVALPSVEVRGDVDHEIQENLALWRAKSDESKMLVGLRDALLPELLSGRLRVKDAESIVENV